MTKRLRIVLALAVTLVLCVFGMVALNLNGSSALASTSAEYRVEDGASIRVYGNEKGEYGIRFKATVPDNTKEYNMIILPIDYYNYYVARALPDENLVVGLKRVIEGEAGKQLAIVKNCPFISDNEIVGSIVNILPTNLIDGNDRYFMAVVYNEEVVGDETVYHVADLAEDRYRSIASVASKAINVKACADDEDVLNILKEFVGEQNVINVTLPEYEKYEADYFAYGSIGSTTYTIDLEDYSTGNTPLTLERLLEYKEAGFNVLYSGITYSGEDFATSTMKKGMDLALQAGLKVVVTDYRVLNVYTKPEYFASEQTLDEHMAACVKDYASHEAFYGVNMYDEPSYTYAENYGKVYKSLKKVVKANHGVDPYLHCNLLPIYASAGAFPSTGGSHAENFKEYLKSFILATADDNGNIVMDRLSIDVYPYRATSGLIGSYYSGLQIFAETCQEYGVETTMVMQSYSGYDPTTDITGIKPVTVNDMYQQMNAAISMGITDLSFYTYYARSTMTSTEGGYSDIGSFLTVKGNKTNIYYFAQQAMKEAKAVTGILANFDYLGGKIHSASGLSVPAKYTMYKDYSSYVGSINTINVSANRAYVSEFKDSANSLYAYAVFNPIDENEITSSNGKVATVKLTFDSGYDYAYVIHGGVGNYVKLTSNIYNATLSVGDAVYVIPLSSAKNVGLSSTYGKAQVILENSEIYHVAEQSIDLYELIKEEEGVTYSFKVNGTAVSGRTYYIPSVGEYQVAITATKGSTSVTANTTFTATAQKSPYHDRFDLIIAPNKVSWFTMDWANYFTVSVDGGAEKNIGTATEFIFADNGVSEGDHAISVKGYLADGSYKEAKADVVYSADGVKLVNANSITSAKLNSTSGTITYSGKSNDMRDASFINLNREFTDQFIKVTFTALGVNFVESGIAIGIRNSGNTTDVLSGWGLVGNHAHGLMINYGQNAYMNRFNGHGEYTDVVGSNNTFKFASSLVVGKEYSIVFGIVGEGEERVMHFYFLDTDGSIIRQIEITWAQMLSYATANGKTLAEFSDVGGYTIFNSAKVERTVSYEIIPYESISAITTSVTGLTCQKGTLTLTWNALAGVSGYQVKVNGGEWIDVGNVTSYSLASLDLTGDCTAEIRAYYAGGYTCKPTKISFTTVIYPSVGDNSDDVIGDIYG